MDSEKEAERAKDRKTLALISASAGIINTFIWASAIVIIFYCGFDTVKAFAGKISAADLKFMADIKINKWVPTLIGVLIGGPGFIYGLRQRKLRKKYIDRYTSRIKFLEENIDPHRSSSGLTSTGDNPPED